jgi:hypothetical protein
MEKHRRLIVHLMYFVSGRNISPDVRNGILTGNRHRPLET